MQGYLAHKKHSPFPRGHKRALSSPAVGPRGVLFLVIEVPLQGWDGYERVIGRIQACSHELSQKLSIETITGTDSLRVVWCNERCTTRAEDARGTPSQNHISPNILAYEKQKWGIKP